MPRLDWAAAASSSPVVLSNRYCVLGSDEESSSHDQSSTMVRSRCAAKRLRQGSRQDQQSTSQPVDQQTSQAQQTQQQSRRQQARRLLLGTSTTSIRGLAAARVITKKAVFCVDNIDPLYDADDVRGFVSSLSVTVISCFEVKPRRRRDEFGPVDDRKAFRLCIDDTDRNRLLDASKWPDSVIISQWYYKNPSSGANQQRSAVSVAGQSRFASVTTVSTASTSYTSMSAVPAATAATQPPSTTQPSLVSSVPPMPLSSTSSVVPPAAIIDENMELSYNADNSLDGTVVYHDGAV